MDDANTPIAHLGLLDDEDIELDVAALELSALDHDGFDVAPYLALLGEMEDRLATIGDDAVTPAEQADALAAVIAGEFGFTGDRAGYDAPVNADMIRVLDRRRGLPIALAILYVALARRLGWEACALNTPGHVVIAVGPFDDPVFRDPFGDGGPLGGAQLGALLGLAAQETDLRDALSPTAMSNRMTLARLLVNQAMRAEQAGDIARATTVYRRMTVVAPGDGKAWWELARLQLIARDLAGARYSLSSMLEVTRDPERRETVVAALEAIG